MSLSSRVLRATSACFGVVAAILVGAVTPAHAADPEGSPGLEALEAFRQPAPPPRAAVENRFFLKEGRFEISPMFGYVPNNPFAVRYSGGAILGYHFSERLSLQAQATYSPDSGEGDLKGLTSVLLDQAYNAGAAGRNFQQPLDKVALAATFGIAYAPFYGKINLFGETVLNFDFYGFAGVGMVSKNNYFATYDQAAVAAGSTDIVQLNRAPTFNEVKIAPAVGVGQNFFINQMMSVKLDARASFYLDNEPQYDPTAAPSGQRLYNNFQISAGLGFFFPRMKPRLYNF